MTNTPYGSSVPRRETQLPMLIGMGIMSTMFVVIIAVLFLRFDHETSTSRTQVGPSASVVTIEKPMIVEKTVTVEKTVDRPVIVEKPVIVDRQVVIEQIVEIEKVVAADPKAKWGHSGTVQEPTDRDACELLSSGYVIEDVYRRQFKLDRRGDMWMREPADRNWTRWNTRSIGWATYKCDSVAYALEYWEDEEVMP